MRNGNGQEIKARRAGREKRDSRVYSIRIPNEKAESGYVCSGIEGQRMMEWSVSCLRNRARERERERERTTPLLQTFRIVVRGDLHARHGKMFGEQFRTRASIASIASIRDRTSTSPLD